MVAVLHLENKASLPSYFLGNKTGSWFGFFEHVGTLLMKHEKKVWWKNLWHTCMKVVQSYKNNLILSCIQFNGYVSFWGLVPEPSYLIIDFELTKCQQSILCIVSGEPGWIGMRKSFGWIGMRKLSRYWTYLKEGEYVMMERSNWWAKISWEWGTGNFLGGCPSLRGRKYQLRKRKCIIWPLRVCHLRSVSTFLRGRGEPQLRKQTQNRAVKFGALIVSRSTDVARMGELESDYIELFKFSGFLIFFLLWIRYLNAVIYNLHHQHLW